MPLSLARAVLVAALLPTPARAQADRTGTGGGPLSTERAGNVTASGQTKPPGRAASPTARSDTERAPDGQTRGGISTGICIGCNAK
ncbi:hypothetical protein [Methylobacterium radiodurans]|uniref:Uncharacterized protein n=1 Tax=Methylobacterium radiodurans TaxID=2202828 RepID=A0A2U8VWR7_9HYPH|nr:hypothetical protein [Methylobacterium radiodurans]AWN38254.1 hypothetical protein DK427_23005 [Methylobacterium radiodurans]